MAEVEVEAREVAVEESLPREEKREKHIQPVCLSITEPPVGGAQVLPHSPTLPPPWAWTLPQSA